MTKKEMMELTRNKIEGMIYAKYYELNPNGDARFGLWRAVLDCKKKIDLLALYKDVEKGYY
jgi:hypothetical protein